MAKPVIIITRGSKRQHFPLCHSRKVKLTTVTWHQAFNRL